MAINQTYSKLVVICSIGRHFRNVTFKRDVVDFCFSMIFPSLQQSWEGLRCLETWMCLFNYISYYNKQYYLSCKPCLTIALITLLNEYKQLIRCQLQLLLKTFCCTLPTAAHWENLPRDDTKISLINTGIPDKEQQRNERHLSLSLPPQSWGAFRFPANPYLELVASNWSCHPVLRSSLRNGSQTALFCSPLATLG